MVNNVSNFIKQPKPTFDNEVTSVNTVKKPVNYPKVGILNLPKISTTPVADTLSIAKQENPHTVYRVLTKKQKVSIFNSLSSFIIVACGAIALKGFFKK